MTHFSCSVQFIYLFCIHTKESTHTFNNIQNKWKLGGEGMEFRRLCFALSLILKFCALCHLVLTNTEAGHLDKQQKISLVHSIACFEQYQARWKWISLVFVL